MNENLFSYGTLQKETVQIELFGRLLNGAKDVLRGWKISPIEITDEAFLARGEKKFQKTLIAAKDEAVEGIVFEISAEELLTADKYEPANYKRIKVVLESGKAAWIYFAV